MPGIVRRTDLTCGHDCFLPTQAQTYASKVFVNGKQVVRKGDKIIPHCCPGEGCHGGTYNGDRKVYAEGRPIQIKGDPITCGDKCNVASDTVNIG